MKIFLWLILILLLSISSFSHHVLQSEKLKKKSHKTETAAKKNFPRYGIASFYATKFHGRKTANGEVYKRNRFTAACNVLPLNTWVKVTNLRNNKTVIVKVNDRMHKKNKRLIDLSKYAAEKLGFVSKGVTRVRIEVLNNFKSGKAAR